MKRKLSCTLAAMLVVASFLSACKSDEVVSVGGPPTGYTDDDKAAHDAKVAAAQPAPYVPKEVEPTSRKKISASKVVEVIEPKYLDEVHDLSAGFIALGTNGRYGIIGSAGTEIVEQELEEYKFIEPFVEGVACVTSRGLDKKGLINTKGEEVVPCGKYESIGEFKDGLAMVCAIRDGYYKYGYISVLGAEVVPVIYDHLEEFSGRVAVARLGEKYGYINTSGGEVLPFKYDMARSFSEDLAWVELEGKVGFIDYAGKMTETQNYKEMREFHEGYAAVSIERAGYGDLWGYVDRTGQVVIPLQFYNALNFFDGTAIVYTYKDGIKTEQNLIDKTGKLFYESWNTYNSIREVSYDANVPSDFLEVTKAIVDTYPIGYINRKGEELVPAKYDESMKMNEGFMKVAKVDRVYNNRYGLVNSTGEIVEVKYTEIGNFCDGLALVQIHVGDRGQFGYENYKSGFINKKGEEVIPCVYQSATAFCGGVAAVIQQDGKLGFIDTDGKNIGTTDLEYDEVSTYTGDIVAVRKNQRWGIVKIK